MLPHDTAFGQTARVLSRGKWFAHEISSKIPTEWSNAQQNGTKQRLNAPSDELDLQSGQATPSPSAENITVGWYGPKDPENPRNWSSSYKALVAGLIW